MSATELARIFEEKTNVAGREAVGDRLVALVAAGQAAWPKIALTPESFVVHLARHATGSTFLDSVHASDLYLACAVASRNPAALAAFEEAFMARVPDYIVRVRIERQVVEEVQQKLRETLILGGKIAEYSGKGALGGWLRVAAVRTALNHIRSTAGPAFEAVSEELSVGGDPELAYVKEQAHGLLGDAFKKVLAGLDPNERAILRLHYLEGLTMDQLAHLYKTPRSTIARRVAEVRQQILTATEGLLRSERRLTTSAIASVIRQARSELDVTISRLLE